MSNQSGIVSIHKVSIKLIRLKRDTMQYMY